MEESKNVKNGKNKGGRPKKNKPDDRVRISLRLDRDAYALVKSRSKQVGCKSVQKYFETLLLKGEKGFALAEEVKQKYSFLLELHRIGVNLNQMAKVLNAEHHSGNASLKLSDLERVEELKGLLASIKAKI